MNNSFLGTGWGFPPKFTSPDSGPDMEEGEMLVKQAISIALNTLKGERPFWSELGSGLSNFVFEDVSESALVTLKQEVSAVLLNYEPRIILEDISFDMSDVYEGALLIELTYLIRKTNSRSNMVFPFYLAEQSV
ncbi:GPW/gp25 family protein [Pseudoalteromonas luteoviolacea]|uniref:IraD/Gp25-like domain-containing protein n=1 Tax=Pseudoalteromonas luteoviolacea S4054 TaxID=1129367 RepID=A0A0F6AB73_9GAMM|nr:GPW/gp25 family protein [Pseudoalteromonas luteoviolacea]AOT08505.1 hypothetical protein S4054249_11895 [Pseudoalteromonas luteoviolacea]AOT13421.1 hypothetical protein S40542_11870 [Pseudoalteromonas luteoviolacea]AOT18334.1 hypothetical protein S4054_11870 [Pseudoalteromonas luteoviolacea]KKE83388.1 hypothetical protein N479_14095 [Pseudoalteromonas luteoviolacea S4054]KZN75821.1 hypothetical protein N481_06190 [Pseudoalteromonas luteoviolacea S4047-1]